MPSRVLCLESGGTGQNGSWHVADAPKAFESRCVRTGSRIAHAARKSLKSGQRKATKYAGTVSLKSPRLCARMASKDQDFSRKQSPRLSGTGSRQSLKRDITREQAFSEATAECCKFQTNKNNTKGGQFWEKRGMLMTRTEWKSLSEVIQSTAHVTCRRRSPIAEMLGTAPENRGNRGEARDTQLWSTLTRRIDLARQ